MNVEDLSYIVQTVELMLSLAQIQKTTVHPNTESTKSGCIKVFHSGQSHASLVACPATRGGFESPKCSLLYRGTLLDLHEMNQPKNCQLF